MIRNLSLALKNIAESTTKTIAVQLKSLDFLAKVLDNRIALDYLLVSKAVSMLWPAPLAAPGLTLLGKLKLSYIRSLNKGVVVGGGMNWEIGIDIYTLICIK